MCIRDRIEIGAATGTESHYSTATCGVEVPDVIQRTASTGGWAVCRCSISGDRKSSFTDTGGSNAIIIGRGRCAEGVSNAIVIETVDECVTVIIEAIVADLWAHIGKAGGVDRQITERLDFPIASTIGTADDVTRDERPLRANGVGAVDELAINRQPGDRIELVFKQCYAVYH